MNKEEKSLKNTKGITLVALVITIIVLLILAAVSINLVLGENGILRRAREGRTNYVVSANEEHVTLSSGASQIDKLTEGEKKFEKGPNGKPLVNIANIPQISHDKIIGEDANGNQVVVPDGFKVASDSATTVKDGIVIEDSEGNQYVWVPVSNINHDGSNKIKVNSASEEGVEITLGRYTFDTTSGEVSTTEGAYQYASTYATPVTLKPFPTASASVKYYQELTTYRVTNGLGDLTGTNTTARGVLENGLYNGIKGFIESVRDNRGFYIARYEASYRTNGKAGSKVSTTPPLKLPGTGAPTKEGYLWTYAKHGEAATACYDLYSTINSDLMNSYAWDTTIVYIQAMGNANYANAKRVWESNPKCRNTGTTQDQKCKIFDMAANEKEWTTEYSSSTDSSRAYSCTLRGGCYGNDDPTYSREKSSASYTQQYYTFRCVLYL